MTTKMLRPVNADVKVFYPESRECLPPEGASVEYDSYWVRRHLYDRDVEEFDPSVKPVGSKK